jgi:hypothetical protein
MLAVASDVDNCDSRKQRYSSWQSMDTSGFQQHDKLKLV